MAELPMVTFRAADDERLSWEKDAERRGLKFSEWLREACRSFLKSSKAKRKK